MKNQTWRSTLLAVGIAGAMSSGCAGTWVGGGVAVVEPPPPAYVEAVPVAPAPGYVWIGGFWTWHDRWVWEPGHWAVPPRPHARWQSGHWERAGRGYHWREGRWR